LSKAPKLPKWARRNKAAADAVDQMLAYRQTATPGTPIGMSYDPTPKRYEVTEKDLITEE